MPKPHHETLDQLSKCLPPLLWPEAARAPCSLPGSPGSVHFQGSAGPALVLGSSVTDYAACHHLLPGCFGCMFARQDRGLELCCRFPGSHSKQVPESWCHSSATWPCVPHACARPINQHFWAMVQQLLNQALGSPRYSCPPQLRILGCPDLNCWRNFLSSGELPVERQCVLKRWWIAETLPSDA